MNILVFQNYESALQAVNTINNNINQPDLFEKWVDKPIESENGTFWITSPDLEIFQNSLAGVEGYTIEEYSRESYRAKQYPFESDLL